jgi:hypothetical protein
MKKITLLFSAFLLAVTMNAQEVVFEDSFDTYDDFIIENVGSWTLTDVDQLPTYTIGTTVFDNATVAKSFQVFNPNSTVPALEVSDVNDWTGRTGDKAMVCFAAVPAGGVVNDDWLISPAINLGTGGSALSFWYKATNGDFSAEEFTVSVSTTGTEPADFTVISANPETVSNGGLVYVEFTADLTSFEGSQIYIGIHCTSNDQFGFMVDDFVVTSQTLSNDTFVADNNFVHFVNNNSLNLQSSTILNNIAIFSLDGKRVINNELNGQSDAQIDINGLNQGIYIAKLNTENGLHTFKFAK